MTEIEFDEFKKIILEILQFVNEFCVKNNIRYSICGGTLLGAVRHKGFVPWDDDIDIMMPRPDYERFLNTFNNQDSCYKVLNGYSYNQYFFTFAKVVNTKTFLTEEYDRPIDQMGVNIDVFPVDGLPNDKKKCEQYWKKIKILRRLSTYVYTKNDWREHGIKKIIRYILFHIFKLFPANFLSNILNKYARKTEFDKSVYASKTVFSHFWKREIVPITFFNDFTLLDFEGLQFKAIKEYKTYLTSIFGNYMELPPVEKRVHKHSSKAFWR